MNSGYPTALLKHFLGALMTDERKRRRIRSFVKRTGRITPAQHRGIEQGFARYGLTSEEGLLDSAVFFGRNVDRVLEIGFGMGDAFIEQVQANPGVDFIGVEVHSPGVGSLLKAALDNSVTNLAVYSEDVNTVLQEAIPDGSLSKAQLFFPDPWPKKRHHKRRLVSASFVALVAKKLKTGGQLHLETDWEPYAEQMITVMEASSEFRKENPDNIRFPRFSTRFERRGVLLGHRIVDLAYIKNA